MVGAMAAIKSSERGGRGGLGPGEGLMGTPSVLPQERDMRDGDVYFDEGNRSLKRHYWVIKIGQHMINTNGKSIHR